MLRMEQQRHSTGLPHHRSARPLLETLEPRRLMAAGVNSFAAVNLVSNGDIAAAFTDADLVNAWGLAASPTGPWWVADNGTGKATTYNGTGVKQAITVTVPPVGDNATSAPTGEIFNGTTSFQVTANGQTAPALFIFATEDGTISGWNPNVDAGNAVTMADMSTNNAVFKGLATATVNGQQFLFATDFHNRTVQVFDSNFAPTTLAGNFSDPAIPARFAPFGIALINGQLYVSYARRNANTDDDIAGLGRGFVDVFNTDGTFVNRLVTRGRLDSPWGMVQAPATFGKFANALLVGNFGNGRINAFDPTTGQFLGQMRDRQRHPIVIDGLWSLGFGNGQGAGSPNRLFFTAGPNDESSGLFGRIRPTSSGTTTPPTPTPPQAPMPVPLSPPPSVPNDLLSTQSDLLSGQSNLLA
jgi:uncharacterized protein (TIGR03118 family)